MSSDLVKSTRCRRCTRTGTLVHFDFPKITMLFCWPCKGVLLVEHRSISSHFSDPQSRKRFDEPT